MFVQCSVGILSHCAVHIVFTLYIFRYGTVKMCVTFVVKVPY